MIVKSATIKDAQMMIGTINSTFENCKKYENEEFIKCFDNFSYSLTETLNKCLDDESMMQYHLKFVNKMFQNLLEVLKSLIGKKKVLQKNIRNRLQQYVNLSKALLILRQR